METNGFYPGSTPAQTFTIPYEADSIQKAIVTYDQYGKTVIEKEVTVFTDAAEQEMEACTFSYVLTQEESLKFTEGDVTIQVNCYFNDTTRTTSEPITVKAGKQLHRAVIT